MADAVRLAILADEAAIVALTRDAYAPYVAVLGYEPLPMGEDYAARIRAAQVWLTDVGAMLAGLIVVERHASHALIYSVAVDPALHGQKIGSRLLDFAEASARSWGVAELRLYTNAKMLQNQAIYAKRGFRETGRREIALRPGFIVVDMAKAL